MKQEKISLDQYLILAYKRQETARSVLTGTGAGVCACRICRRHGSEFVTIDDHGGNRIAYGGLQTCKMVWVCPLCSIAISRNRRALMSALAVRQRSIGNEAALLTYTVSHKYDDSLTGVLELLKNAHKKMHSGAGWQSLQRSIDYRGSVKTVEINIGSNGWHAHLHEIVFFGDTCRYGHAVIFEKMARRWSDSVAFFGGTASLANGFDVRIGHGKATDYVTKWGLVPELINNGAKTPRTGGFSPFQLLDVIAGNPVKRSWAKQMFFEYYQSTASIHQFNPSDQYKREFKDSAKTIKSDAELEPLAQLTSAEWAQVWERGLRGELLIAAKSGFLHKWLSENITPDNSLTCP